MRIFGLVDCNSFFASCEKVFHPDWQNRPVVVLSNNDGCVVARSPEAKALQIPMGAPWFQIRDLVKRRGLIVCSANYSLYGDMSSRVMQTISQWSPDLEFYSIDEAFIDFTGRFPELVRGMSDKISDSAEQDLHSLSREIVSIVPQWTGIPVSLGIGSTKTLAKAANRIAKKLPAHYARILTEEDRRELLPQIDLSDVWGVGRHLLPKFQKLGLRTAWDLAQMDPHWIRKNYTVNQEKLVLELRGEFCTDLEEAQPRQTIQISRSFGEMITDQDELEKAVSTFAARAGEKIRQQHSTASAIHVQLYTNRFRSELPQYFPGMSLQFPNRTSSTPEIIAHALRILRSIYDRKYAYKKAAVLLLDLADESISEQPMLFDRDPDKSPERREKEKRLMQGVDAINRSFGKGHIFFASEGVEKKWTPVAHFVSPCFTTRWEDLPVAYAK
ncbi:MAG: Y-family DNA polymerase [Planctomycetia bacterium]|nr:Y-family DNA polymerase [Planctomycetia bacterium]